MNTEKTDLLAQSDHGAVRRITLTDVRRRNALSESMISALTTALEAAAEDSAIRVVVLAADGPAFSAGHDLKEISGHRGDADGGQAYFEQLMAACSALMQTIVRLPKPMIAEVRGVATAAGCQLVASCDLAVAGEGARFCTPGVNIGLFCSTPMVALSRNVSRKHAMEMLLTGDLVPAARAAEIGLVNRVVAEGDLEVETMRLAERIASKSQRTLKIGKEAFYRQVELPLSDAYDYAAAVMTANLMDADACEGISAFLEKRAPTWER
ncbi:2,3-dehydroadipyl-CoA hydratase [Hartmannibacter diazotrophicus]|uniref:Enoyl-CoA hydratase domain-containing protein 3, mitochondrial n=1 Tax=Hartmannibacter diazotrophicus TaxID=1482074 RepID=A0A2C9D8R5_9HYPH|nr:enoyl-CoA hydratase [Hartmannibacter diazotrophicus]SON55975.1 2,3-dehydroadipyl-CoA hydratase [Hartmannibacter diazotrophicus]